MPIRIYSNSNSACDPTCALHVYYVVMHYRYCIYVLVAGQLVFMIHISVPFTSLCQQIARSVPQARCLYSENVAIGFKTSIEAYFVGKSARMPKLLEVSIL